jgi:hypothetical protein
MDLHQRKCEDQVNSARVKKLFVLKSPHNNGDEENVEVGVVDQLLSGFKKSRQELVQIRKLCLLCFELFVSSCS